MWFSHKIDLFRPMCKKQAAWMKMHSHTLTLGGAYGKAEIPGLPYTKQCAAFSFCTRVSWRRKEVKQYLQCLAKVFIPLHFVHVLLCSCLMLNCFKLLFSTSIYTPCTIMVKQKQFFNVFANLLKLKNLNWLHCISIHTLIWDSWNLAQEHTYCLQMSLHFEWS